MGATPATGNPTVVSVVGLGKLGAPLAACLASKGYRTTGVDHDAVRVAALDGGTSPLYEPGLQRLIDSCREKLSFTSDYQQAIDQTDVTFVIVPTPSDGDGLFSPEYLLSAVRSIGRALKRKDRFHLVVVTSTVMPGTTADKVVPAIEESSGKRCGVDFGVCYNPEFVALGSVIQDMLRPDFILIGESDQRSGDRLAAIYDRLCENDPPIARMNFVNAELTKLAVNTFVTTKISYANSLADICERLDGADVDEVTSALGLDSRIGPKYLKGAIGYGGPCFPRDNLAFAELARRLGTQADLAEATDRVNRQQVERLARVVLSRLPAGGRVGVLGLSYKPETDVVEESQGVELARSLADRKVSVVAYDPAASDNARAVLGDRVEFAGSAAECVKRSDVVAITTPWDEFRTLSPGPSSDGARPPVVVDCWRVLERDRADGWAEHVLLGTRSEEQGGTGE